MAELFKIFLAAFGLFFVIVIFFAFCKAIYCAFRDSTIKDRLIMCGAFCGFLINTLLTNIFNPVASQLTFEWATTLIMSPFLPVFKQLENTVESLNAISHSTGANVLSAVKPSIIEIVFTIVFLLANIFFMWLFLERVAKANLKKLEINEDLNEKQN